MAKVVQTNQLPAVTDLTGAYVIGLNGSGVDAKFPLSQLIRNSIGQFKITDAAPTTPLLNQSYDLIGTAAGSVPSGTYTNLKGVGNVSIVIPVAATGHAIINAKAVWNGTYWVPLWNDVLLPVTTNKILPWVAASYLTGDQVNYLGIDWIASANLVSTDIPGTSPSWINRLSGYTTLATFNSVIDKINYNTNTAIATMPTVGGVGQTYINNFTPPVSANETVNTFAIAASAAGNITIVKSDINFANLVDIQTVSVVIGVNTFSVNIPLGVGERLGIRIASPANIKYTTVGGIGGWALSIGAVTNNFEVSYTYASILKPASANVVAANKIAQDAVNASIIGSPINYKGILSITSGTGLTNNTDGFFNNTSPGIDGEVAISFSVNMQAAGAFWLVKSSAAKTKFTDIIQLTATAPGVNIFAINVPLSAGERLGLRTSVSGSSARYASAGGVGFYTSTGASSGVGEINYTYQTTLPYKSLAQLSAGNTTLATDETILFSDNFATNSNWGATGWTFAAPFFTATATGVTNRLNLPLMYHADKRAMRCLVTLGADSDLRLHNLQFSTGNTPSYSIGFGSSMFGVSAITNKLTIYAALADAYGQTTGITDTPLVQVTLPFSIVPGRQYLMETIKDDITSTINFTDTLTGLTAQATNPNWDCGRQNDYYGFFVASGNTSGVTVGTKLDVRCTMKEVQIIVAGDSITEGLVMNTRAKRYAAQLRARVPKLVISARGGDTIAGIITKFDTEYRYIRPKRLVVLIGANGGNSATTINQLVALCATYNIKLYLNHMTCNGSDTQVANNTLIDTYGLTGCKFDVATALDNYPLVDGSHPSPRANPSLYAPDKLHPNEAGNDAMFARFAIDAPGLLNI